MDSIQKARSLRRNSTEAENALWAQLRGRRFHNLKFRRQVPIPPFIADFYCNELKLIIESDGGQHSEETDRGRTRWLESKGYRIVRFWNNDVLENMDGVLERLAEVVRAENS